MTPLAPGVAPQKPLPAGKATVAAAALLLLGLAALAAVFFKARLSERNEFLAGWETRLESVAEARRDAVQSWLNERRADAQVLAWSPDLVGLCVENACPRGVSLSGPQTQLNNLTEYAGFLGAYLFTPTGHLLLSAEKGMDPCPGLPPKVRSVVHERSFRLDDVQVAEDCGQKTIGFLAPVFKRLSPEDKAVDAPVIGVVGLYLSPEASLFPLLTRGDAGDPNVMVYLVRRAEAGAEIFSPTPLGQRTVALGSAELARSVELAAVSRRQAAGRYTDFANRRVVAAVRWLPEPGWGLVASVDEATALREWKRDALRETALALLGTLCLALLGLGAWRGWAARRYRLLVEGLRDQEERLRAVAFGTEDLIFVKNRDGRYLLVNPATAKLLGTTVADAVGKRVSEFLHPEVAVALEAHDREVLESGVPFQGEEEIADGSTPRTFLSARIPVRDSQGAVQGVAGVLRDITERKRSEATLARRAQSLAALYRLSERFAAAQTSDAVLDAAVEGALDASGVAVSAVLMAEGRGGALRLARSRQTPAVPEGWVERVGLDRGAAETVFRTGRPEFAADRRSERDAQPGGSHSPAELSIACIPVKLEDGPAGVLVAGRFQRHEFSQEEQETLEALGHMAGVALSRVRAQEDLAEQVKVRERAEGQLRRLHEASAGLSGDALFGQVAGALSEELDARWVEVSRVDLAQGTGRALFLSRDGNPVSRPPFVLEGSLSGEVARAGGIVHCERDAWKVFPKSALFQKYQVESCIGVPLMDTHGEVFGVLSAFGPRLREVGPAERDLLELYARRVAGEVERQETEKSLVEARRTLETLIQNIPGAVYRCAASQSRSVQFVSPGCASVTGHPPEDFAGDKSLSLIDLVVPEDRSRVRREVEEALLSSGPFELEYRIHDRAGTLRWIYDVGRVVEAEAGSRFVEGVLLDQTERRVLEAQLTHSQRMEALGRLAGGVAHDFNNLLTAISGYAEILERRFPEGDRSLRAVREIIRASDRAADLTRQLLAFSRRQTVEPKVVDLNEAVQGVVRMLGRLLGEDVEVRTALAPEAGTVRADPGQLEQVVLNLCVNARDAMPAGGCLAVRTGVEVLGEAEARAQGSLAPGEYAILEVTDTGVGIAPEVLEHIFEPFFTTKKPGEGTGLGLATVYGIVKQAGGEVTVRSAPGEGASFLVRWPRRTAQAQPAEDSDAAAGRPGRGETVLLVEDEESVRRLAVEHLQDMGYRVAAAAAGPEALEVARKLTRLDLMVTDVIMPGMSGPELARRIREERPSLPVVFMSGHTGETALERGAHGEGVSFVQKPFRLDELTQAVSAALGS